MLASTPALAQESQLHAEFRAEGERIKDTCNGFDLTKIGGCAMTLATDRPVHLAFGSIAPQNGFGLGVAFVTHHTPNEHWRMNWNADAVGAPGGAWRAGAYMKIIHTPVVAPVVIRSLGAAPAPAAQPIRQYAVVDLYAQALSLPTVWFFGLGPSTTRDDKSVFGLRETVIGTKALVPVTRFPATRRVHLSLVGEINGRFVGLRSADSKSGASIFDRYTEQSAPGLTAQPSFVQLGEAARISPVSNGTVRLNYQVEFQQFVAPSDATFSFRRWTIDLGHEIALYHNAFAPGPRDTNGPNECSLDPATDRCPAVSRNRTGTIGFRVSLSRSQVGDRSTVPFYFQRTLGGSDINGTGALASYDDYRFRGPHVLLLQQRFEHSIYGPVGVWLAADQGKVTRQPGRLTSSHGFVYCIAAGATLRAGGFPAVVLSLARGGTEGYHFAMTISPSLLGGSARPSLH